jgi:YidC/Oxa1 family membrane protein insertase
MDKNTFAGLFLMLAIIVGSFYFMPSQDEIAQEQRLQDSLAGRLTEQPVQNAAASADTSNVQSEADSVVVSGPFGAARNGSEQLTSIENELIKVNISNKGGRVKSVELKGQKDYLGNRWFFLTVTRTPSDCSFQLPA